MRPRGRRGHAGATALELDPLARVAFLGVSNLDGEDGGAGLKQRPTSTEECSEKMARKKKSAAPDRPGCGCLLVGLVVLWIIGAIVGTAGQHPAIAVGIALAAVAAAVLWRWHRKAAEERDAARRQANVAQQRAALAADVEKRKRSWAEAPVERGPYSVILTSVKQVEYVDVAHFLEHYVALNPALDVPDAEALVNRVRHIGPQAVVTDVDEAFAMRLKIALEDSGAKARITETLVTTSGGRAPIQERVRNEVWRRDGGRCVDCGSRERLEFDHIIPVSKGGANTARNIELRCETCNRKKAAKI